MTKLALASFAAQARGVSSAVEHTILPDTGSPGVALTELFQFQSYYDDALLEKAILPQAPNEPIIGTTKKTANVGGYCFGLHPSSQAPVAVQPIVGGQGASPQAIILKPGQIYRPHGRPGNKPGHFSGLDWGLPYGYLGGGVCTLYVFPSADADVAWPGDAEVLYHRQRMRILAPADISATATFKNWPLRFPWTQAVRGANSIPQKGAAIISISQPTRVMLSLRLGALGAAGDMRMILQGSNDFDVDSAGAVVLTNPRFDTVNWPAFVVNGGAAGNLATNFPVVEYNGPFVRIAADDGGMQLVDMSGGALSGAYVDVARYGKI